MKPVGSGEIRRLQPLPIICHYIGAGKNNRAVLEILVAFCFKCD